MHERCQLIGRLTTDVDNVDTGDEKYHGKLTEITYAPVAQVDRAQDS